MATLTDRIVDELYATSIQPLQAQDITFCRGRLIDYLGVTFAGARLLECELRALLAHHTGHGTAPLIGLAATSDPRTAALCNGMSAHAAELDDGERHGMVHPGAPVISAILAAACSPPPGRSFCSMDLWRAILTGYESTLRMARWLQPQLKERGYHASGVCGTIGAAMGVATLLGLSREQMKVAFSAAVTGAAGSLKVIRGASQLKPYNTGQAALAGYNAATIAQTGLNGPEDVLEGELGFVQMITGIPGETLMERWPSGGHWPMRSTSNPTPPAATVMPPWKPPSPCGQSTS
ncbi:hypothetical protein HOP52_00950 [Halomonas campisalis]|uniref:MmgE/PrpD N-terminal domain-containing protein n=1 Tax=Billgrantia campisalis TaxID=74661 RepID=A0ABS9P3I1_9GAMM|nr:MmgE/PrpD family protein [Halomonas campisalis]MCG6656346.1 hypothetical protein [Halomonas campisalis]MDR5861530.1 MmgE/PrpD family protein [Halomonas campisalis]